MYLGFIIANQKHADIFHYMTIDHYYSFKLGRNKKVNKKLCSYKKDFNGIKTNNVFIKTS